MGRLLWQWLWRGGLALWLGGGMPLLCIPGISSNHTHGLHWAWDISPDPTPATLPAHTHDHGAAHPHSPPSTPALTEPTSDVPRSRLGQLAYRRVAEVESLESALANAVGLLPPAHPPRAALAWSWLKHAAAFTPFKAAPLRPWRPPPSA